MKHRCQHEAKQYVKKMKTLIACEKGGIRPTYKKQFDVHVFQLCAAQASIRKTRIIDQQNESKRKFENELKASCVVGSFGFVPEFVLA